MNEKDINEFYSIQKSEFDFRTQKLKNFTIRFYNGEYYPPTMGAVLGKGRYKIIKGDLGFKLKEVSEDIKTRFANNIKIQKEIINIIKKRNEEYGYTCGIIKMETGLGKGNLTTQIVDYFQQDSLILVSNTKLLKEMIDRFKDFSNITPSQYGGGKKNIGRITICTKSSFIKDYELFKNIKVIIIDELHQGFTDKFRYAINKTFHNKQIAIYGMSGTTYTQDLEQHELEKYYGKTIDLKIGYNLIPEFIFLNFHNSKEYEFAQWHELKEELFSDLIRYKEQKKFLDKIIRENKYILVLSDRIAEIERLYSDYEGGDYEIIKITGGTKVEEDSKLLEKARTSGKKILIIGSISKVGTGFDFAMLDTIFLISSIKFKAQTIQAVGRILRIHNEKTKVKAYIWNDQILKKQKTEKLKTIIEEYGITKRDIKEIEINKQEMKLEPISLIF